MKRLILGSFKNEFVERLDLRRNGSVVRRLHFTSDVQLKNILRRRAVGFDSGKLIFQ